MSDASEEINLNVKGPSELKLSLTISNDQTVRQLKEKIESEKPDFAADAQRLIYAGKVLKDDELLSTYKIKDGNTIHMVKSAAARSTGSATTGSTSSSNTSSSTAASQAQAQGVPSNFSSGQTFTNNPLSALNRADYAGPHMARLLNDTGGMFGGMGLNPRDPNMMLNMMQNPQVQSQLRDMMSRPEFIDQMIALNPQLQGMAPQMREMMRSEQFREFITNPESMQRIAQLSEMYGDVGGMGGLGGAGGATPPPFPPPGAFGIPANNAEPNTTGSATNPNNASNPNLGLLGLLNGLGAGGGQTGAANPGANPFADPALLQQILGGGAESAGSLFGNAPPAARETRPAEERFASQLEQMQQMGFFDGQANIRALLMSGGSVEGAVGILLDNPNPPAPSNQ